MYQLPFFTFQVKIVIFLSFLHIFLQFVLSVYNLDYFQTRRLLFFFVCLFNSLHVEEVDQL